MKATLTGLLCLVATTAFATPPTTRPVSTLPPAAPVERAEAIDPRRPAFVPKFARADSAPVGHIAEREYAYRYGSPGPIYGGYGCYVGGYYGCGFGTWGGTTIQFR